MVQGYLILATVAALILLGGAAVWKYNHITSENETLTTNNTSLTNLIKGKDETIAALQTEKLKMSGLLTERNNEFSTNRQRIAELKTIIRKMGDKNEVEWKNTTVPTNILDSVRNAASPDTTVNSKDNSTD